MPRLPSSIIPKASAVSGEVPSPEDLVVGEIAVNTADGTLFTKHADSSIVTISGGDGGGDGGGGAAIPIVRGSTIDSDADAAISKTLNSPAHLAGDLLVACIVTRDSGGAVTPPSGWTLEGAYLQQLAFSGITQQIAVYTKIATDSEPASYVWSQAASSRICGLIVSIGGSDSIESIAESYGQDQTATIDTIGGYLNITVGTWIYAEPTGEPYSQSGNGLTEITDSPNVYARISGGYTTQAGTVTSYHEYITGTDDPNHGVIRIVLNTPTPDAYVTVGALQAASAGAANFAEFQAAIAAM